MPVARAYLGQEGQAGIAEETHLRDERDAAREEEAVAFGIIDIVDDDGRQQARQIGRIHLAIARHHDRDIGVVVARPFIARGDRPADALVLRMLDQYDAGMFGLCRANPLGGRVPTLVIDDDDVVDIVRHRLNDVDDVTLFVVRRYHRDDNGLADLLHVFG